MAEQENNGACSSESCSGCAHADSCASKKVDMTVPANEYTHVKKVIGVISGKGGVGKSMVTASLARLMREQGYSVGILDADITGPSIPKMYGIHEHAMGTEVGMFPCIAKDETRIMSVNLLLDSEDTPVIWRGPVIAGVVKQFWNEVLWGDLDYLFVDMPPGTGDVPLTVFQSLPVDGVVIVTSPQDLVQMIVKKTYYMAKQMNIPMIYMDFYDLSMETDSVSMDNISAEYKMTEYLIELGHKKIAYVGSINATTSIMDRYLGYRRALHHYNILYREDYLIEDRGEDRLFKELALPEDMPTAFVCNNDEIACILIEKLEKMGYSVPEDISVTGFDNYPFIRRNASGLTTVDVDIAMMASEGVELLLERLNDKRETFVRRVVSGHIVIRKSTGKAATEP